MRNELRTRSDSKRRNGAFCVVVSCALAAGAVCALAWQAVAAAPTAPNGAHGEINPPPAPPTEQVVAIVGALLINGRGEMPVAKSTVVIRGDRIVSVGPDATVVPPDGAERINGDGMALVPGLLDSHFHIERDYELPRIFLSNGVTSVRDPGQWLHVYDPVRKSEFPQPRCFVAGPHLDQPPHAYPKDAFAVTNAEQARATVNRFVKEGASHIKVYYRLPLELIRVVCDTAHERGLPVTAHLELVDADRAIEAGLDGIEHVTSFGTALAEAAEAEAFRESVRNSNEARRKGRYELWSKLDFDGSARVQPMVDLIVRRRVVLSPTLAVFERRAGDRGVTDVEVRGFANMLKFVGRCHKAGARIVVGSHSSVPKAERGWAYQRELELLVEAGLTPIEAIRAGTLENARFFGAEARLGSLEPGKQADLVLIRGNPTQDIGAMRQVHRVMMNGRWVR